MSDFLTVLGPAVLPAAGNFFGGVLAELFRVSGRTLSLALHLAARGSCSPSSGWSSCPRR